MAVSSPCLGLTEKKQWWLSDKQVYPSFNLILISILILFFRMIFRLRFFFFFQMANRYVKDAKCLISAGGENDVVSALNLLDAALVLAPRYEQALELKARSLLYLRRYKDVADMLQEYLPSMKIAIKSGGDESSGSENSSQQFSREQAKLLASSSTSSSSCSSSSTSSSLSEFQDRDSSFKCFFSVADLKRKIMAGLLCKCCENESRWR